MTEEEKLLIAKTEDLFKLCDKYSVAKFSGFLNEAETECVMKYAGERFGYNTAFFGGFSEAERRIFGVFPDWEKCECDKFPLSVLKVEKGYSKSLSHRDYLGTVLSLGIERSKVGDIVVSDDGAFIFVIEDIADYICGNIQKVANCGVNIKRVAFDEFKLPIREFEEIKAVAASPRVDAVIAASINISRREATLFINSGKVNVNHKIVQDTAMTLKVGCLISIRGVGRFVLEEIGANTKSGRIHILLKKYAR